MTEAAVIGVDIGKTSFHLVAVDVVGAIQWKKKVSRTQLMRQMEDERVNRRAQRYLRDLRRDAVVEYN